MRIIILGAGGRLGAALTREYREKFDVVGFNHAQLDLAKSNQIRERLSLREFDVVVNCAAMTNVDLCESQPEQAFAINAEVPKHLAEICSEKKTKLIHFSTDYVFDGEKREPYVETDPAKPISVYGESKRAGEENVLAMQDRHLVVRVSWVFGPDRSSFIDSMIRRAREEELDCCRASGVPLKAKTVRPEKMADMKSWSAGRPVYSVLSTARYAGLTGLTPRSWRDAVADYIERSYSKK